MQYLAASEYEQFGLEAATPEPLVAAASALVDSLCRRPSLGVTEYTERLRVSDFGRARLSYLPLYAVEGESSALKKVRVRYGTLGACSSELMQSVAGAFGLAGAWVDIDPASVDAATESGELTLPVQPLGLPFVEAEITYTAGFAEIPEAVKVACAQLVRNAQAAPALNLRRTSLDGMQMEYFRESLADDIVRKLLARFVATRLGA